MDSSASFADHVKHLNGFIAYMKAQGVDLHAISIRNEPDYAEKWTAWSGVVTWVLRPLLRTSLAGGSALKIEVLRSGQTSDHRIAGLATISVRIPDPSRIRKA